MKKARSPEPPRATSANSSRPRGGTLFLDEIGDMPLAMQAKLLRVLEEGEIERVGGDKPIAVDARVVVATHRNLEEMVRQGTFRADLFHRVYVFPIVLPPLRERPEEIPVLAEYFAAQVAAQNGWRAKHFSADRSRFWSAMRGPAMCANCATWSNACSCCLPRKRLARKK